MIFHPSVVIGEKNDTIYNVEYLSTKKQKEKNMRIGYNRVSTIKQNLESQKQALLIFKIEIS